MTWLVGTVGQTHRIAVGMQPSTPFLIQSDPDVIRWSSRLELSLAVIVQNSVLSMEQVVRLPQDGAVLRSQILFVRRQTQLRYTAAFVISCGENWEWTGSVGCEQLCDMLVIRRPIAVSCVFDHQTARVSKW